MPLEENKNFLNEKREHPTYEKRVYEPKTEVEKIVENKKKKKEKVEEKKSNNNNGEQLDLF